MSVRRTDASNWSLLFIFAATAIFCTVDTRVPLCQYFWHSDLVTSFPLPG